MSVTSNLPYPGLKYEVRIYEKLSLLLDWQSVVRGANGAQDVLEEKGKLLKMFKPVERPRSPIASHDLAVVSSTAALAIGHTDGDGDGREKQELPHAALLVPRLIRQQIVFVINLENHKFYKKFKLMKKFLSRSVESGVEISVFVQIFKDPNK